MTYGVHCRILTEDPENKTKNRRKLFKWFQTGNYLSPSYGISACMSIACYNRYSQNNYLTCLLKSVTGFLVLLTRQVMCEVSRCYSDVNICLWTDGSYLNQSEAQSACQQRNSFLPRITNITIQSKLSNFRLAAWDLTLLGSSSFWIDVKAVGRDDFHWMALC